MKMPKRPSEWQAVADAAHVVNMLGTAEEYDFLNDPKRAALLLEKAKALGYIPRIEACEQVFHGLANNFRK